MAIGDIGSVLDTHVVDTAPGPGSLVGGYTAHAIFNVFASVVHPTAGITTLYTNSVAFDTGIISSNIDSQIIATGGSGGRPDPFVVNISEGIIAVVYTEGSPIAIHIETWEILLSGTIVAGPIDSLSIPDVSGTFVNLFKTQHWLTDDIMVLLKQDLDGPTRKVIAQTLTIDVSGNIGAAVIDSLDMSPVGGSAARHFWFTVAGAIPVTGSHTGAADQAVLTDAGADFVNEGVVIGDLITNITDGSQATITVVTAMTITGILAGGTDNDWDNGDTYTISIASDMCAVVYEQTNNDNGTINTFTIDSSGNISAVLDSFEFDTGVGEQNRVSSDEQGRVFINSTGGVQADVRTLDVDDFGNIFTNDSINNTSPTTNPGLIDLVPRGDTVADSVYLVIGQGRAETFTVDSTGTITETDQLAISNIVRGVSIAYLPASGNKFIVGYTGSGFLEYKLLVLTVEAILEPPGGELAEDNSVFSDEYFSRRREYYLPDWSGSSTGVTGTIGPPEVVPPQTINPGQLGLACTTYTPIFGGAAIAICLELCVTEWRMKINTNAIMLNVPDFQNLPLPLNYAKVDMTLRGIAARQHTVHPLTSEVDHVPDIIDLEEAAMLFNKDVPTLLTEIKLELVSGFTRTYTGVITKMALVDNPGTDRYDFIMTFSAGWNVSNPALREWNTFTPPPSST